MRIVRTSALSGSDPTFIRFDVDATGGSGSEAARDDHIHEITDPQAPTTVSFGASAAPGSGADPAREDHVHGGPGAPLSEVFFPVIGHSADSEPYTSVLGNFEAVDTSSSEQCNINGRIPDAFGTLAEAMVVVIADATETVQWDCEVDHAQAGEIFFTHRDGVTNATQAVTINEIEELDVSDNFTAISAGDYFGMIFGSDTDNLHVIGLLIRWS